QEFFRWEVATAVAGAVLGINPFDQPDVEASKVKTRALTEAYEASGELPSEQPLVSDGLLSLFADPANGAALGEPASVEAVLGRHLARAGAGDYFALLAYLDVTDAHQVLIPESSHLGADTCRLATRPRSGPRFQH